MEETAMEDLARRSKGGAEGPNNPYAAPFLGDEFEVQIHDDPAWPESRNGSSIDLQPPPKRRIIEKVPWLLKTDKKNEGNFNPKMVSIGPYHHGDDKLQMAEKIKPTIAQLLVSDRETEKASDLNEFRRLVLEKVKDARSCYIDGSTDKYCDREFADMMLYDGCFVLGFTEMLTTKDQGKRERYEMEVLSLGMHSMSFLSTDMFCLLENQLPFLILDLLMRLKFEAGQGIKMLDLLLDALYSWDIRPWQHKKKQVTNSEEIYINKQPLHLLEYFWLWENDQINQPNYVVESRRTAQEKRMEKKSNFKELIYSFRSVTELKAKGIQVKPSSSHYSGDIKFKSFLFSGVLELPPLIVSPYDHIYFSNLIAYEWWPNNRSGNILAVTSYANFMKSLINHPDDVKELRSNEILFSTLSSDEEVVRIFDSISTFGIEDYSLYDEVKESIRKHCKVKAKTWMAELIHDYFSGPWTFIAFLAAFCGILLTFVQTYFTIFPPR